MKGSKWLLGCAAFVTAFLVADLAWWVFGITTNSTVSMPVGLWTSHSVSSPLRRGDIVVICATSDPRFAYYVGPYVGPGHCNGLEPMLKPIAAVAGDMVEVTEAGVIVNGGLIAHSARQTADGKGRSMAALFPPIEGKQAVVDGTVWLIAPTDKSFDSRYFGALQVSAVIAKAYPLLVWEDADGSR